MCKYVSNVTGVLYLKDCLVFKVPSSYTVCIVLVQWLHDTVPLYHTLLYIKRLYIPSDIKESTTSIVSALASAVCIVTLTFGVKLFVITCDVSMCRVTELDSIRNKRIRETTKMGEISKKVQQFKKSVMVMRREEDYTGTDGQGRRRCSDSARADHGEKGLSREEVYYRHRKCTFSELWGYNVYCRITTSLIDAPATRTYLLHKSIAEKIAITNKHSL